MPARSRFNSVDEYLAALRPDQRSAVDQLRGAIKSALPDGATEVISYQIIGFKVGPGRPLVWLAALRDHYSIYPYTAALVESLGDELTPYLAGKGTIRFPADQPLPLDLVRRIVSAIAAERAA